MVVEVLCDIDLWWSGRRKSAIDILHGGYVIDGVERLKIWQGRLSAALFVISWSSRAKAT
jgi:hypothetical protein